MICVLLEDDGTSRELDYPKPPQHLEMYDYVPPDFHSLAVPQLEEIRVKTITYSLTFILEYDKQVFYYRKRGPNGFTK